MSRKLGTLTLDMVAKTGNFVKGVRGAEAQSSKSFKKMEKDAIKMGKAVGAAASAAVVAVGVMAQSYVNQAAEIERFAQISGSTTDEFQRQAAGAAAMSIQGDKLADIYKDVNEKLGEFARTGGGGAADFFDDIAPKIGVTIDQFKRLSGPEALQFYKDSLDKAGLSQKEQIFYLESLASDTSLLIPLLADGGRGFDVFADSIAASGAIMSEEGIEKARQMAAMQTVLKSELTSVKNQIAQAAIPTLLSFGGIVSDATDDSANLGLILGGITHASIVAVGTAAITAATSVNVLRKSIAQAALIAQKGDAWLGQGAISGIGNDITGKIGSLFGGKSVKFGDSAKAARQEYQLMSDAVSAAGSDIASDIDAAAEAIRKLNAAEYDVSETQAEIARIKSLSNTESGGSYGKNTKQLQEQLKNQQAVARSAESEAKAAQRAIESERAARKSAFDQFVAEQRTEQQIAHETFIERTALINEFTVHGSEQYSQLAFAASHEMSAATAGIEAELMRQQLDLEEYKLSEIEIIKRRYEIERKEIEATAELSEAQRAAALSSLNDREGRDIGQAQVGAWDQYGRQTAMLTGTEAQYGLGQDKNNQISVADDALAAEIISAEEHAARLLEIERNYQDEKNALTMSGYGAQVESVTNAFGIIMGKQSGAYQLMFAGQKAFAIAQSSLKMYEAISQVMADPTAFTLPQKLANYGIVAAQMANIISSLTSVNFAGQAHAGLDYVPREGTYLLDKGEAVLQPAANQKLNRFLDDQANPRVRAMDSGAVTAAAMQGRSPYNVTINNNSSAVKVSASRGSDGAPVITIDDIDRRIDARAGSAVARDLRSPSSPVSRAMGKHTTAKPALA